MIAQLCLTGAKGGLELSSLRWALDFRDKTNEPSAMIVPRGSFLEQQARDHQLPFLALPTTSTYFHPYASLLMRNFFREHTVKTVFVHSLKDLWLLYPSLIGLSRIRVIGVAHMFLRNINKKDLLHRRIYSPVRHLIALTQAQKSELLKCLPVAEEKYVVIPNGVDISQFAPAGKPGDLMGEWNLNENDFVIGYVGRLDPQKGVFELLEAARKFRQKPHVKFVILGDDTLPEGPTKKRLLDLSSQWDLKNQVRFIPFRPDVARCMRAFDLFVMPSYQETFGLVLIEAMASGLPCLATNAGGPPEILDFGRAGLLVEPRSSEGLYRGIAELLEDAAFRETLAQRARQKAVECFDKNLIFQRLQSLTQP